MNGEDQLLPYVEAGIIRVDRDGSIWRCKIRRVGNGWSRWDDQKPTRAETFTRSSTLVKVTAGHGSRCQAVPARLVWRIYRGPIPHGMSVYHRDFDVTNNDPDNLFLAETGTWGSHTLQGLKLTREDYIQKLLDACEHRHESMMILALAEHGTQNLAAEAIGVNQSTIARLVNRLRARIRKEDGGTA